MYCVRKCIIRILLGCYQWIENVSRPNWNSEVFKLWMKWCQHLREAIFKSLDVAFRHTAFSHSEPLTFEPETLCHAVSSWRFWCLLRYTTLMYSFLSVDLLSSNNVVCNFQAKLLVGKSFSVSFLLFGSVSFEQFWVQCLSLECITWLICHNLL